jgi:hypothetical protein
MLSIDIDVSALLPPDTISHGFDNIADVQAFSPTVLEGYLRAAAKVSRDALGDPTGVTTSQIYKVPRTAAQLRQVEGAPVGTRGGVSVIHIFPADGEYTFRTMFHSIPTGQLYGSTTRGEQIEISINGQRMALLDINPRISESDPKGINLETTPIFVKAGPQRVSAAFIGRSESPFDDLIAPIDYTLADTQIGSSLGVTTLPHLRELAITGPTRVMGVSDSVSRRRVFFCRPTTLAEEEPCADKIVRQLADTAFRRPVSGDEAKGLLSFYSAARQDGDFEAGIHAALQAVLASPQFLFRLERAPAGVTPGQNYRITDIDLASRLSQLRGCGAGSGLVGLAMKGTPRAPGVDAQVRMLRIRARPVDALCVAVVPAAGSRKIHRFADVPRLRSLARQSVQRETELLFDTLIREDRNLWSC